MISVRCPANSLRPPWPGSCQNWTRYCAPKLACPRRDINKNNNLEKINAKKTRCPRRDGGFFMWGSVLCVRWGRGQCHFDATWGKMAFWGRGDNSDLESALHWV